MARITNYETLKDQVTAHMMRGADSDFIAEVPLLIQLAEADLKRNPDVRQIVTVDPQALGAETVELPTEFKRLESLVLTGPTYFGPLKQVHMNELEELKTRHGDAAGRPTHFAIVRRTVYLHPVPSQVYTARLVYSRTFTDLSDSVSSNWLLANHPDIYLYSALVEAAPYLKDDNRIQIWKALRDERIENLRLDFQEGQLTSQAQPSTGVTFGG